MTTTPDPSRSYLPARDALGSTAPLAFEAELPLLGIPLRVRSNARKAIELASTSFSVWHQLDRALIEPDVSIEMRVIVHDPAQSGTNHATAAAQPIQVEDAPLIYRRYGSVLVAASGATLLTIDLGQRLYTAFVPPAVLERSEWYAWHINGMARFAVSALDRHPFHAATWLVDDTAVVVTGPPGAGKSTLAFAALRQGFPLLCEEATHVSLARGLRLWGHAEHVTLAADAVRFFPELVDVPVRLLPSGKMKRAVPTMPRLPSPPLTHAGRLMLCVLARERRASTSIEPLSPDDRDRLLSSGPDEGFDQFPDVQQQVATAFTHAPAYRLVVGPDPTAAVLALADVARR